MAGTRKTPKLRFNGKYYVVNIYKPDGKRTMISFGPPSDRTKGEIHTAFYKWLDLFNQQPQKVLSFKSPYDAIEQVISDNHSYLPATIKSSGQIQVGIDYLKLIKSGDFRWSQINR